jgi:hypothetical protein
VKIAGIRSAIRVRTRRRANGVETVVTIDHRIPGSPMSAAARWRISTAPARLPASEFDKAAAINRRFSEGRALRCVDLETDTTAAAVAYHLDDTATLPILLTAVATRSDPDWMETSQGCVPILKTYLHELGSKLGRPTDVAYFAPTESIADTYSRRYGFRRAPVPSAWKASGPYYLVQPLADDD